MAIKILLVDDQPLIRHSVKWLIEREFDMEIVDHVEDGVSALEAVRRFQPDVVVMDVMMPNMNGIETTRAILEEYPDLKVLGLSMYSDRRFVQGMLDAGASGYVLKDTVFDDLVNAIHVIKCGKMYVSAVLKQMIKINGSHN